MANFEQIISEQNESSHLDFKSVQYRKEKYEDFLTDIIAMANADTKKSKYIAIGIKAYPDGTKEFIGITDQFVDEATYQQLVNENIEPDLRIDYFTLELNSTKLGIFHITDCDNPPYMLKKDYGKLKRGDAFIRKGSHQTRITRKDIDKFILSAVQKSKYIEDIEITALVNNISTTEIKTITNFTLPSNIAERKIMEAIEEKEKKPIIFRNSSFPQPGGTPYKDRSLQTLKENLKNVKKDYEEDDMYYLYELKSHKLNFQLLNTGKVYLEDASIQVDIEMNDGLYIPDTIFQKPDNRDFISKMNRNINSISTDNLNYPSVTQQEGVYKIFQNIGNLKHQIPCDAFDNCIRIFISDSYQNENIEFKIKVFGKNLDRPLEKNIVLKITN